MKTQGLLQKNEISIEELEDIINEYYDEFQDTEREQLQSPSCKSRSRDYNDSSRQDSCIDSEIEKNQTITNWAKNENGKDEIVATDRS